MSEQFVGIDLETSAGNHDGRIIQVGISLGTEASMNFCTLVYPNHDRVEVVERSTGPTPAGTLLWEKGAEKVHGIPYEQLEGAPAPTTVDRWATDFLNEHGIGPKDAIAVGWNVGTFDMPFVRRELPELSTLFHYRHVDLNSLVFGLAEGSRRYAKNPAQARGYEGWKKLSKRYASLILGGDQWHDAGFDARASLVAFRWLAEQDVTRTLLT